jgi:hypothetical protein
MARKQEALIDSELARQQFRDWWATEKFGIGVRHFGSLIDYTDDYIRRAFHAGFAAAFVHIVQRGYSFKKPRAKRTPAAIEPAQEPAATIEGGAR